MNATQNPPEITPQLPAQVMAIISQVESGAPLRTAYDLSLQLKVALDALVTAEISEEAINPLIFDYNLCSLRLVRVFPWGLANEEQVPVAATSNLRKRFRGIVEYDNGAMWPDPDLFPDSASDYFKERLSQVTNPVLRARYAEFLGAKANGKERRPLALQAANAYLEAASPLMHRADGEGAIEALLCLDGAAHLTTSFGLWDEARRTVQILEQLIEQAAISALTPVQEDSPLTPEQEQTTDSTPKSQVDSDGVGGTEGLDAGPQGEAGKISHIIPPGRWILEMAHLLFVLREKKRDLVSDDLLRQVENRALQMVQIHQGLNNWHFVQSFLKVAMIAGTYQQAFERAYEHKLAFGAAIESEGDARRQGVGASELAAASFYESALDHYIEARDHSQTPSDRRGEAASCVAPLKKKMRAALRAGQREYGVITQPFNITPEEVERWLAPYHQGTTNDVLQTLGGDSRLWPKIQVAEHLAKVADKEAPLWSLLSHSVQADDMTIAAAQSEEEKKQLARVRYLSWQIVERAVVLDQILTYLQQHRGLNEQAVLDHLDNWGYVDEENIPLLEVGLKHYFAADYVSALHILVPQFEDVLRTFFEGIGGDARRRRSSSNGWNFKTFDSFLEGLETDFASVLPADVLAYIRIVMTEQTGFNLRNRIAHGLISVQECDKLTAHIVLHLLLVLTSFRVITSPVETEAAEPSSEEEISSDEAPSSEENE